MFRVQRGHVVASEAVIESVVIYVAVLIHTTAVVDDKSCRRHLIHVRIGHGLAFTIEAVALLSFLTSPANATLEQAAAITATTKTDFFMENTPCERQANPAAHFKLITVGGI